MSNAYDDVQDRELLDKDPQFAQARAAGRAVREHFAPLRSHMRNLIDSVIAAEVHLKWHGEHDSAPSPLSAEASEALIPVEEFLRRVDDAVQEAEDRQVDEAILAALDRPAEPSCEQEAER
jgi:hypothetical protein